MIKDLENRRGRSLGCAINRPEGLPRKKERFGDVKLSCEANTEGGPRKSHKELELNGGILERGSTRCNPPDREASRGGLDGRTGNEGSKDRP